ncbi:MAG: leucine-rich repeat protein [Symploca sp. SIO2E9]|nr:leucine-rich repeat protein [Symploca sp. SIO2E9]
MELIQKLTFLYRKYLQKDNIPVRCLKKIREAKENKLEELNLSNYGFPGNKYQLTKIPEEVFELKNLRVLILRNNIIYKLPKSLGNLSNLTKLDLSYNQLSTLPEFLENISNLTKLYLIHNQLSTLPESLGNLSDLTELDLSGNQLSTLPESLGNLSNLTELDLSGNQLSTLPESLGNLSNLTELNLSDNQLSTLPESLGNLTNLTKLYLSGNQLSTLPESLGNLTNLTKLYLSGNQLSTLPESLGNLTNLTDLDLSSNQLSTLPQSLGNLTNLTKLDLNCNQLSTLPESLGTLTNLTDLNLNYNQLSTLPESLGTLTNLTDLNLNYNQLSTLPESLGNLTNLAFLYLRDNPLVNPPPEIVNRGIQAIRDYFRQIKEEGEDYIYEAKLLIVGEAEAGKTSLAQKIQNPQYQLPESQPSTEGIDVVKWSFTILDKEQKTREFKVNIWDFGGQEIYHATHQFFLTKRSLYTLVADSRKEDTDFYYWLKVVELLSDNSPLLIVKNEKQDRYIDIEERRLRGEFTNLKEILATNLKTNRELDRILDKIKHYIQHLPHVGSPLPKTWVNVKKALEENENNYVSLDNYLEICKANGFADYKDAIQLSQYLHDLGVCLHFQDDPILSKTVILKPEWGTDAVYKVLDNKTVINNLGRFSKQNLADIWSEAKYQRMLHELLQLMLKFKLCYEIPNSKDNYIAPQLLSKDKPDYPSWNSNNILQLRYSYEFMPKGILTRLIVEMHRNIYQDIVWRYGVIVTNDYAQAEVIEYYDKKEIRIRIIGKNKRDLMTIVTNEIDKINDEYERIISDNNDIYNVSQIDEVQ